MTLVLYHNINYTKYFQQIQEIFEKIPNKQLSLPLGKELIQPFDEENLGKLIKMKSMKKEKILNLTWILDEQETKYKNPPLSIINHVLGHEGKGTIKHVLAEKNLIYELCCGAWLCGDYFSML